jgi:flavin reductase (DIM6/NTAB) family NADH-FMN oxidoreductase RutF
MTGGAPDPQQLRRLFGLFATGVTVATGRRKDGSPAGVTANSFTSLSLDPPLILWCLSNRSASLEAFAVPGALFAMHILTESQGDIARRFAKSGFDKFADATPAPGSPPPQIEDALARLVCVVEAAHPGGDHTIIVGRIKDADFRAAPPLVFHASQFGRFVSGGPAPEPFPTVRDERR